MNGRKRKKSGTGSRDDDGDDDDDDIGDNGMRSAAFAVDGVLPPEHGEAKNGLDYLRRVRWEAQQLPFVSVSDIPEALQKISAGDEHPDLLRARAIANEKPPEKLAELSAASQKKMQEWFEGVRRGCEESRRTVHRKKKKLDAEALCPLCAGSKDDGDKLNGLIDATVVSLSLLLEHISIHCEDFASAAADDECMKKMEDPRVVESMVKLMFGIICVVERPLLPDDSAALNSIHKWCTGQLDSSDRSSPVHKSLLLLAVLIPTLSRS